MKIKTMDRESVRTLHEALKEALKPLEKKFGTRCEFEGGRFNTDEGSYSPNITLQIDVDRKSVEEKEKTKFKMYASAWGLKPSDFGRRFTFRGESYIVCGIRENAEKYGVVGKNEEGKRYCFPVSAIQ